MSHTPDEMNMLSDECRVVTVKSLTSLRERALNLEKERDELQQQRDTLLGTMKALAFLGNGGVYGNSTGNLIAQAAIASIESPPQE